MSGKILLKIVMGYVIAVEGGKQDV